MVKYSLIAVIVTACLPIWSQPTNPQMPGMEGPNEKEARAMMWKEAGNSYSQLFQGGPNMDAYLVLAEQYSEDSKPIQARFYYELALSLDPTNEQAKKGWDETQARVDHLNQRFSEFSEQASKQNEVTSFGSMAAIRFHLGFYREGFDILQQARIQFGDDMRIAPLRESFLSELEMQAQAVSVLYQEFESALNEKQADKARMTLGQIVFITKGNPQVLEMWERMEKTFKELNQESAQLLAEFTKLYPNRKS